MDKKIRCSWCGDSEIYVNYHDLEWGRPVHDDQKLFEMLILESMQAGLSWITVLKKRDGYREEFDYFDINKIANYDQEKLEQLKNSDKIIKNKLKIESAVTNAKAFLSIQERYGSFDKMIWSYVDGVAVDNKRISVDELPSATPLSEQISKDLKKMGFKFMGATTVYAFMQAIGMINDHIKDCFVYQALENKDKNHC